MSIHSFSSRHSIPQLEEVNEDSMSGAQTAFEEPFQDPEHPPAKGSTGSGVSGNSSSSSKSKIDNIKDPVDPDKDKIKHKPTISDKSSLSDISREKAPRTSPTSSLTHVFRECAKKNGYTTPTVDCVQAVYSALHFPSSSCFETIRTSWKCSIIVSLAMETKKWVSQIDKSLDITKVKDATSFQRQLQRSLDILENECGFHNAVSICIVISWLTDTTCSRRLVVRTALHEWLSTPSSPSSTTSDEAVGVIDYYNSTGYLWLVSSDWQEGWLSLATYILSALIKDDRCQSDLVKLRSDWINLKQKTDSVPLFLSKESELYQLYTDALLRYNLPLPSAFERVTSLISNSSPELRAYVSKTIRDNEAVVHDLTYGECKDMFLKFHRKVSMVLSKDVKSKESQKDKNSKPRCRWCRRRGHKDEDCWFKPDQSSSSAEKSDVMAKSSSSPQDSPDTSQSSSKPSTTTNDKSDKKGKNNHNYNKKQVVKSNFTDKRADDAGVVTRSQTGKLPSTTPSSYASKTFAILPKQPTDEEIKVCMSTGSSVGAVSLLYVKATLVDSPYQCILDTASCYTLTGPRVLSFPGVISEPISTSASTFSGHSLNITHEVILPVCLGDHHFNVRAYVCATASLLRDDQILFGLGTLSNMGAVIDLAKSSVHFSALEVDCELYSVGDSPGVAVVQTVAIKDQPDDDDDDLNDKFNGLSLPTASFSVEPTDPIIRPTPWKGFDPVRQQRLDELLGDLEAQGVIERIDPSAHPDLHVSRAFAIHKKAVSESGQEKWRLVVDFRQVNSRLVTLSEGLKDFVDCQEVLIRNVSSTERYYAVVDVSNAFHCIPITNASSLVVGITNGASRFWKYKKLPQGLSCSPLWWAYALKIFISRLVSKDVADIQGCGYATYVDDIIVFADDEITCQRRLQRLLKALRLAGLTPNEGKTQMVSSRVEICGIIIDNGSWYLNSDHQQQIRDMAKKVPKTPNDLRSALGIA
ncbi:hypothetical protein FOL47_011262 [Perkinsus chesapeaki]|uniref:Reverse transcriptase domain-containing protein n=1 Tax=Perkinsus chesapeaki TaxID=330153 RepID=A0A7J6KXQ8_PERCH|nr:hypothetical protein FOL47_011262 [Perkinsus chesapeaki]